MQDYRPGSVITAVIPLKGTMDGLLASLSLSDIATYFPLRQFIEREIVEGKVRNPGTGEMVNARRWVPKTKPETVSDELEFPTESELSSLEHIDWVNTHFDNYILASLIALVDAPKAWASNVNRIHSEILRFEAFPSRQCERMFGIPTALAQTLTKTDAFDFESDEFNKNIVDFRYFQEMANAAELCRQISTQAIKSLNDGEQLVLWCRGDY